MWRPSPVELLIILLIVIAVFGAGKLAGVGGAVGKAIKEFRSATKEEEPKTEEGSANTKASEDKKGV